MNDVITLIFKKKKLVRGTEQEKELRTDVFAEVKSVGCKEFYQANQAGFNASIKFKLYSDEWCKAELIEYNGTVYKVIRAYKLDANFTELTCSEKL